MPPPPAHRNDSSRKDARRDWVKDGIDASKKADRRADEAEKKQKGGGK